MYQSPFSFLRRITEAERMKAQARLGTQNPQSKVTKTFSAINVLGKERKGYRWKTENQSESVITKGKLYGKFASSKNHMHLAKWFNDDFKGVCEWKTKVSSKNAFLWKLFRIYLLMLKAKKSVVCGSSGGSRRWSKGGGGGVFCLPCRLIFLLLFFRFFTQNKGGRARAPHWFLCILLNENYFFKA